MCFCSVVPLPSTLVFTDLYQISSRLRQYAALLINESEAIYNESALPIKTTILDPFTLINDDKGESQPYSTFKGFLACMSVVQDILLLSSCAVVSFLALNLMII